MSKQDIDYPPPYGQGVGQGQPPPAQGGYPQGGYPQGQQGGYPQGQQGGYPQGQNVPQGGQPYYQPQPQPYYQPGQQVVIAPMGMANPPSDHLALAIFVLICCCLPFGIVAVIKSVDTRECINRGDAQAAARQSRDTRKWCMITLGCGIACHVIWIVIVIIYVVLFAAATTSLYKSGNFYGSNN